MMRKLLPTLALLALGACREEPASAPATEPMTAAEAVPVAERLTRDRIYYNLTNYEWYAQGKPLLREGQPYQPAGMPVAATLSELKRAGEYGGVEYYVRADEPERVYVPVFDGYWLPFQPSAANDSAD